MGQVEMTVRFTRKEVKDILTDKAKEMAAQKGVNTSKVSFVGEPQDAKETDDFATVAFKLNGKTS